MLVNPGMQALPTYIKDSKQFIQIIEQINEKGPLQDNTNLVAADMEGMYPNMPLDLSERGVKEFLDNSTMEQHAKQTRLKMEIQFARESSTTLPSVDPLFRIQVTLPSGKRRDKNPAEFAESLMAFLGKKADSVALPYNVFRSSLQKYTDLSDTNNN